MGLQVALPRRFPRAGVDSHQIAIDVGEIDEAPVVDGGRHVGRRPAEAPVPPALPEDLAVGEADGAGVAVLVDDVGDAVGDGRWELDQGVGVDRPGFAQGRAQVTPFQRQVVGALGHTSEERPIDQRRSAALAPAPWRFVSFGIAGRAVAAADQRRKGGQRGQADEQAGQEPSEAHRETSARPAGSLNWNDDEPKLLRRSKKWSNDRISCSVTRG